MTKKTYFTHDNGGRPFRVEVEGNAVTVSKVLDQENTKHSPTHHLFDFVADEIFIGKKSPMGGYDGVPPRQAIGNSVLLRIGNRYVFIGESIFEFQPLKGDTIESFYSDIGNSDVPYPYAVGKTHVYILLHDYVAIAHEFFDPKRPIYLQYYEASTYLPISLKRGHVCEDRKAARARIKELKDNQTPLKIKVLEKRAW